MRLLDDVYMIAEDLLGAIDSHLDFISSLCCVIGALACIYLAVVIMRERAPLVGLQRWSLGLLAIALMSNALYDFPDWLLINGHRPTGTAVNFMFMVNLLVMVLRGSIMTTAVRRRDDSGTITT